MAAMITESEVAALGKTKVVDARGVACPGPMIEAKRVDGQHRRWAK